MKWSFATIGIFILGIVGVAAIILFQKLTTSNENDYYLLKEITEAAMYDSIDFSYYKSTGHLKIVKEKFVENFTRRYAETTLFLGSNYIISFYDIIEEPPKVSIMIDTDIYQYQVYDESTAGDYNVNNYLTGIFEYIDSKATSGDGTTTPGSTWEKIKEYGYKSHTLTKTYYYSDLDVKNGVIAFTEPIVEPEELTPLDIETGSLKIKNITVSPVRDFGEMLRARLKRELDWQRAKKEDKTDYSKSINMNNIATTISQNTNISYWNCNYNIKQINGWAKVDENKKCNNYDGFWINYTGKTNEIGKSKIFLKLNITWAYNEHEYEY